MGAPQYVLDARTRNNLVELDSLGLKPNAGCVNCEHYEPLHQECMNPRLSKQWKAPKRVGDILLDAEYFNSGGLF